MERGQKTMNAEQSKAVCDEIAAAFQDVRPPVRCTREEHIAYDRSETLEYYAGKTWLDIADDLSHLAGHIEFSFMNRECLLYFLPGYLIGSVRHKFVFVEGLITALLGIMSARETEQEEFSYLLQEFTPTQKKAVAHWARLQLELDKERRPNLYEGNMPTLQQLSFNRWQQWG